jgi:hypothetical protein
MQLNRLLTISRTTPDQEKKADPRGGPKKVAAVAAPLAPKPEGLREELAAPAPRVAIYNPPAPGTSHAKHAILGPALRLDKAEANLTASQLELHAAKDHLRSCELIEADALSALIKVMPAPSQDEVFRELLAKEQAAKLARVSQGLPAVTPKVPTHGNSAVDIAAANRPRTSAQQPTGSPLRSPIARRLV